MNKDPRSRRPANPKDWPKYWRITKAEAMALIQAENWKPDPENDDIDWDAYVSDRGEALRLRSKGRSTLFASREALMEKLAELAKPSERRSYHCLEGQLPQGAHFIEAIPSLIDELATLLKLPRETFDGSFETLPVIDAALKKKARPKQRVLETPNFFAALIAYTGEVIRKEVNGVWWLHPVEGGIYEPLILLEEGKLNTRIDHFVYLYKMLAEPGPLSIGAVAHGMTMEPVKFMG